MNTKIRIKRFGFARNLEII